MLNGFLTVGVLLLIVGAVSVLGAFRGAGPLTALRRLVFGLLFIAVGGLCVGARLALRSFEAFAAETVVADVRCRWTGSKQFTLMWTPSAVDTFGHPKPKMFQLRGDQWSVSGGVVKWHPWLTALGLPSYHKPARISGRYANTEEETAAAPTAFALDGEIDPLWWWLYRLDPWLPFVEAVYGSAAYQYVNPALAAEVRVTPSGYLIKPKRPARPKNPPSSRNSSNSSRP